MRRALLVLSILCATACAGSVQRGPEPDPPQADAGPTASHTPTFEPEMEMCLEPLPDEPEPEPCGD